MPVVLLIVLTATVAAACAVTDVAFGAGKPFIVAVAATICVVPAVATLSVALAVRRHHPASVAAVALLGAAVRMMTAVAGVVMLKAAVVEAGGSPSRFAEWVAAFYTVTLAVESAILIRVVTAGEPRAGGDDGDRPAPAGR